MTLTLHRFLSLAAIASAALLSGCALTEHGAIQALGVEVANAVAATAEVERQIAAVEESGWGPGEITAVSGGLSGLALIGSRILSILKHGRAQPPATPAPTTP